jgi:2-(1,2-epoxy-1,2-dihydrophenyl)acetyl-CoA isomerase
VSEPVALAVDQDGVARLTFDRPEALNAVNEDMMRGLYTTVKRAVADPAVAVVVLRSAGEHFMAGGDIKEFRDHLSQPPDGRLALFRGMIEQWINPSIRMLRECRQPVIAQVRGACAGFGFSLMLACDLALAAEGAYFTTGYALIGTSPDGGGTWFLPRLVGTRKAAELTLLSGRLSSAQALDLGLINRVVSDEALESEVGALAQRLARGPRRAHAEIKRLVSASGLSTLDMHLQAEAESFGRLAATEDFAEGIRAFCEKREPQFKG